ncbi:MAG: PEP/pyruvate-binding domain-containing protein, partial [Gammaproteobacteria bacterium]|nr:PEP/pyruvate-binding domain-containing protein [Gammaproteobacteria bacterium]
DLAMRQPIPLADLESALSGRVVGPKAANLGQLARLFPGRVAPAVAVPFGIFAEHMDSGTPSLRDRLIAAYTAFEIEDIDEAELLALLESIRQDVAALEIMPVYREALRAAMIAEFGEDPAVGLFLRSDTNVEDLPQFTGAGLSETVPNVIGIERQIDTIPRIWASVLSPRAIAWRSNLLTNPEEVYASVLLMQSVPSTKSGVMVTADLTGQGEGLTVSTGWGVGGAVAGESVETIVLRPDGQRTMVTEAKTAYQRNLDPAGGIRWVPAPDGPVLTPADERQLRELAEAVAERYEPVYDDQGRQRPWDIEFGFVDGELTLFQIRPLVERGAQAADRIVEALTERTPRELPTFVSLRDPPLLESN